MKSIYCLKCKRHTSTNNYHEEISKNGKLMGKGICQNCGSKKNIFLGQKMKK